MTYRLMAIAAALLPAFVFAEPDAEGSKDHPMFPRLPGYYITSHEVQEFGSHEYTVAKGKDGDWEITNIEGRRTKLYYEMSDGKPSLSSLQVHRNYENAAKALGGATTLYANNDPGGRHRTVKIRRGDAEVWLEIMAGDGGGYSLEIVERGGMRQDITSSWLFDALSRDGRVALQLNFDTGKATLRSDAKPVLEQITGLLKEHSELALGVEGHTDNVGNPAANKKLSADRAQAVVAALVAAGVDGKRLQPAGFGQEKPVADNATDSGRAENRRVELVKR